MSYGDYLCQYCCEDIDDCLTEPCEERLMWWQSEYGVSK